MTRKTYILLVIFVLLLITAYLVMQRPGERSADLTGGELLVEIDSLSVERISIRSPESSVALEKKGIEWYLTEPLPYRADQPAVTSLIHQIKNLRVRSVVSSNPEKRSLFQVDSTGTIVTISERGKKSASFVVGKTAGTFSEVYVRRADSDDVGVVGGVYSYTFNKAVRDWRDRTILAIPRESIREIKFRYGDTTFVLALQDTAWMIGKEFTEKWVTDNLLSSLSNFQADDFVDSVLASLPRMTAQLSVGGVQVEFFFDKVGDKYYVRTSTSPQWYVVYSWKANQVLKRKKELLKSSL